MVVGGAVIAALADCRFPEPSRDGEFLTLHTLADMLTHFGTREDDARNLFTARMLLLLESQCIQGGATYERAIDKVLGAYWRNLDKHPTDYLPIILLNDISRYWRIVLLNYEAKQNLGLSRPSGRAGTLALARKRLGSHKLRFSRCLLCYSAITFLLAETTRGRGHVRRSRVRQMVTMSPIQRLQHVANASPDVAPLVATLLDQYDAFLRRINASETTLLRRFQDKQFRREAYVKGEQFGDAMFALVAALGSDNRLYRYLVV